jgi:hypothetical protein
MTPKTPMLNKVGRCRSKYKTVGRFLKWLSESGYEIVDRGGNHHADEMLLAQHFGIDWGQFQRETELYRQWMESQRSTGETVTIP